MFDTVYVRDDICVHDHVSQEKDVGTLNFSITTVFYCKRTAYLYKKKFFLDCYLLSTYMGSEKSSLCCYLNI